LLESEGDCLKIVSAAHKAKANAWTFEVKAKGQDHRCRGQGHKMWPRGASSPRPSLEDDITDEHTGWAKLNGANAVSFVVGLVKHVLENFDNFWQVK